MTHGPGRLWEEWGDREPPVHVRGDGGKPGRGATVAWRFGPGGFCVSLLRLSYVRVYVVCGVYTQGYAQSLLHVRKQHVVDCRARPYRAYRAYPERHE